MNPDPTPAGDLPPFCTLGSDHLPDGPAGGTAESVALAAWEVLTGSRVPRSKGSGRMSLLARYRAEEIPLTTERVVWIALHAFEGADERWSCRRARTPTMTDAELEAAIVQEMGGPAEEPDEMSTFGFWQGPVGFHFDYRGPSILITDATPAAAGEERRNRTRRLSRAALLRAARKLLSFDPSPIRSHGPTTADPGEQLNLL
jgi:hypothetical protein